MRYEDIHPAIRNCLGFFEAFRKLGFKPDDIYVLHYNGMAHSILKVQGKDFVCMAGPMECSQDEFGKAWEDAGDALNAHKIPQEDLDRIYEECDARKDSFGFMLALTKKGITFPKATKSSSFVMPHTKTANLN